MAAAVGPDTTAPSPQSSTSATSSASMDGSTKDPRNV
jgi:hypothetical protein